MLSRQILVFAMAITFAIGTAAALLYIFAPAKRKVRRKHSMTPFYANLIWGIIGLLIASFAVGIFSSALGSYRASLSWPEAEATVTYFLYVPAEEDDDDSLLVVGVSYEYEDQQYRDINLPNSSSHMYEGQRLVIRVNPDAPGQLYHHSMGIWVVCAVLFVFGLALCVLGLVGLRRQRLRIKASAAVLTEAERWGNMKSTGEPMERKKLILFLLAGAALITLYVVSLTYNKIAANIFIVFVLLILVASQLLFLRAIISGMINIVPLLLFHGKEALAQRRGGASWQEILQSLKPQPDDPSMQWPHFYGPENQPTALALQTHVDSPLWNDLANHLQQTYKVQPALAYSNNAGEDNFYHGWRVNYKKGGKALCTLYPKPGFFVARIHIGNKEKQEAEHLLRTCDAYTSKLYRTTPEKNNGKALCLEITTESVLRDAKALIALRAGF